MGNEMVMAFPVLLTLRGGIGILVWVAFQKIAAHLKKNPETAKFIMEHVIAPLLPDKQSPENAE